MDITKIVNYIQAKTGSTVKYLYYTGSKLFCTNCRDVDIVAILEGGKDYYRLFSDGYDIFCYSISEITQYVEFTKVGRPTLYLYALAKSEPLYGANPFTDFNLLAHRTELIAEMLKYGEQILANPNYLNAENANACQKQAVWILANYYALVNNSITFTAAQAELIRKCHDSELPKEYGERLHQYLVEISKAEEELPLTEIAAPTETLPPITPEPTEEVTNEGAEEPTIEATNEPTTAITEETHATTDNTEKAAGTANAPAIEAEEQPLTEADNTTATETATEIETQAVTEEEVILPTLTAPIINLANTSLTITNPNSNGNFVKGYKLYANNEYICTITEASVNLEEIFTESGEYDVNITASGDNFNDSEKSNTVRFIRAQEYEVTIDFTACPQNTIFGFLYYSINDGENWTKIDVANNKAKNITLHTNEVKFRLKDAIQKEKLHIGTADNACEYGILNGNGGGQTKNIIFNGNSAVIVRLVQ